MHRCTFGGGVGGAGNLLGMVHLLVALNSLLNESTKNSSIAPGVVSKVKLKLEFWTELLPEALNKTIGAGVYNK